MIYFDNAATTAPDPVVVDYMNEVLKNHWGNPSSIHAIGRDSRVILEDARRTVAAHLGAKPSQIFFTSCGTEAINTALFGAVQSGIRNIISSPIEHHAVLHSLAEIEKAGTARIHWVRLLPDAHVDMEHLEQLLMEHTGAMVCLMHANNEIGNLLDLATVSGLCKQRQALFMADTVQSLGKYALAPGDMGIHFAACSAHKFHGPKGVGFMYIHPDVRIKPYLHGGGQERSMRSGTENVAGIAGLAKALDLACTHMEENRRYIKSLRDRMATALSGQFKGLQFNNDAGETGLYNLINVTFPPSAFSDMLLQRLDMEGVCASGGSACASGAVSESPVLKALGRSPEGATVRFSFSKYNTVEEVDRCIEILHSILD